MEYYKNLSLENIIYINDKGIECIEKWRDVVGYEGLYQVSDLGRLKRKERFIKSTNRYIKEIILKTHINKKEYSQIVLHFGSKRTHFRVHRIVAIAFLKNDFNMPEVNHKNCIKTDNTLKNIEWCSSTYNKIHAYENGLIKGKKGEDSINSKLTEKQVLEIRENKMKQKDIALLYGINRSTVSGIKLKNRWKHI